eukprot:196960-Pyramimonas_sp.AAC.1
MQELPISGKKLVISRNDGSAVGSAGHGIAGRNARIHRTTKLSRTYYQGRRPEGVASFSRSSQKISIGICV